MQNITKYIVFIALVLSVQLNAQETNNKEQISALQEQKAQIKTEERDFLKMEVELINDRLDKGEITQNEADKLKQEVAEKRAANIENRIAIIDNKIALLKRNEDGYTDSTTNITVAGITITDDGDFVGIHFNDKSRKYDRRTTSDLVVAIGFNNAIAEGGKLDDSPYEFWGSRFFELGWAWKTRVFKNSNAVRIKYGFSFQFNGLKPTDNRYFVQNGDETTIVVHPYPLDKAKLNVTNLVFPLHFEFGPSRKSEYDTYFRYSTRRQFKIGVGGYVGFKTGVYQKLKYRVDGEKIKEKQKYSFNTSNVVYGLSGYMGFGNVGLYMKYDLSPIFQDQDIAQNNVSLGVRFDLD